MKYYFVSYVYNSSNHTGYGSIRVSLSKPIKKYDDIMLITEWLDDNVKDNNNNKCKHVILNYIEIKE